MIEERIQIAEWNIGNNAEYEYSGFNKDIKIQRKLNWNFENANKLP